MKPLVAIVGPTGTGKSRLALRLAQTFRGEIVNADSRQVYRHLDIGTAKPNREELCLVPHHLIDIADPDENFNLAQYQSLAGEAIENIQRRHRLPFLVGGSGLYVWAVLEGWKIPQVPPDPEFRRDLERKAAASGGGEELYRELMTADPEAARRIDPRNIRRVIRALEVQRQTGVAFSRFQVKEPHFEAIIIGLTTDRKVLYHRIDARVDQMVQGGLVAEVEKLVEMGYDLNLPAMSSIGYRHIGTYLRGELTLTEAITQIKHETHRLVRHQYAWFRLNDKRIKWFDIEHEGEQEVEASLTSFLNGEPNQKSSS
jgi:tRNA dimethylallyltransferase